MHDELDDVVARPRTANPLINGAFGRRANEEGEDDKALRAALGDEAPTRPTRRAHTNQAHAIPQQGGYAPRGWPSWATGLCAAVAFVVLIAVVQAAFKPAPVAPVALPEQAPAVAPASPQQPAPPAPTTWAPAAAEIPVGFTPGGTDSAIAQGTPFAYLGGVEVVGGVAYCPIAISYKDEGNVEHEARAWGACDALGIAPPPPPAAPVQAAPAPAYVPQSAPAPTERPASDMTPLPTDVPAGWHPPFAPGYDPGNYVTNPEARP